MVKWFVKVRRGECVLWRSTMYGKVNDILTNEHVFSEEIVHFIQMKQSLLFFVFLWKIRTRIMPNHWWWQSRWMPFSAVPVLQGNHILFTNFSAQCIVNYRFIRQPSSCWIKSFMDILFSINTIHKQLY